jgi:outer membrane immunogenic protein
MRTLFFPAIAAIVFAVPAAAQDKAPFTGARVEANVGYDVVKTGKDSNRSDGVSYGGAVGYDFNAGGLVIGAEAELTDSSAKNRMLSAFTPNDGFVIGAGRDIYVGGRIGTPVTPSTLLYAKAGYTNARFDTDYSSPTTARVQGHQDRDGYRLGAGVEQKLARNLYVKAEYRYSKYGTLDAYDVRPERHQVVAGVGLRF